MTRLSRLAAAVAQEVKLASPYPSIRRQQITQFARRVECLLIHDDATLEEMQQASADDVPARVAR